MKKTFIVFLLCVSFILTLAPSAGADDLTWASGGVRAASYTEYGNVIRITNEAEFGLLADRSWSTDFEGKTIILTADLDLSAHRWMPLQCYFAGTFDGMGHSISGLRVHESDKAGLFKAIYDSGTVKNLTILSGSIFSNNDVGGIAGESRGRCINCTSYADVFSDGIGRSAGGIAGYCRSVAIENCSNHGRISSVGSESKAGGIAGFSGSDVARIKNCFSSGNAEGWLSGGIIGYGYDEAVGDCCYWLYDADAGTGMSTGFSRAGGGRSSSFNSALVLANPQEVNGASRGSLLDALNAWVAEQSNDIYGSWTADEDGWPQLRLSAGNGGELTSPLTQESLNSVFGENRATLGADGSILLNADIEVKAPVEVGGDITIDAGSNTLSGSVGNSAVELNGSSSLTIKGTTGGIVGGRGADGESGGSGSPAITVTGAGTVSVLGGSVTGGAGGKGASAPGGAGGAGVLLTSGGSVSVSGGGVVGGAGGSGKSFSQSGGGAGGAGISNTGSENVSVSVGAGGSVTGGKGGSGELDDFSHTGGAGGDGISNSGSGSITAAVSGTIVGGKGGTTVTTQGGAGGAGVSRTLSAGTISGTINGGFIAGGTGGDSPGSALLRGRGGYGALNGASFTNTAGASYSPADGIRGTLISADAQSKTITGYSGAVCDSIIISAPDGHPELSNVFYDADSDGSIDPEESTPVELFGLSARNGGYDISEYAVSGKNIAVHSGLIKSASDPDGSASVSVSGGTINSVNCGGEVVVTGGCIGSISCNSIKNGSGAEVSKKLLVLAGCAQGEQVTSAVFAPACDYGLDSVFLLPVMQLEEIVGWELSFWLPTETKVTGVTAALGTARKSYMHAAPAEGYTILYQAEITAAPEKTAYVFTEGNENRIRVNASITPGFSMKYRWSADVIPIVGADGDSLSLRDYAPGDYTFRCQVSHEGYLAELWESEEITVKIYEKSLSLAAENGDVTATVHAPDGSSLVVARYEDGKMLEKYAVTVNGDDVSVEKSFGYSSNSIYKAFLLNSSFIPVLDFASSNS